MYVDIYMRILRNRPVDHSCHVQGIITVRIIFLPFSSVPPSVSPLGLNGIPP